MHAKKGAAAGGGGAAKDTKKTAAIVAADDPGAEIYKKATCLSCHGAGLKGMPASGVPALLGVGDKHPQDEILGIIKNGKGNMGKQYQANIDKGLSDADITKLAEWLSKQKAQ
jgi:menaquinol-cytochrome c reductase cytochrome b/c subunit